MSGKTDPLQFFYDNYNQKLNVLLDQIIKADVNYIILFCHSSASIKIIQQIRQRKMNKPVSGPLLLLNENELSDQELQDYDKVMSVPSGNWSESKSVAFQQDYQKIYGKMPGMVAAYAFDGMNLLIEAIRNAGSPEREKIQKSLENIHFEGVTGPIQFDDKGNRSGTFKMMSIKNGIPVAVERY